MILAQAVLQIFCSQHFIGLQCKSRKSNNSAMTEQMEKKKNMGPFIFHAYSIFIKFQDPFSNVLDHMQSVADRATHRQAQTKPPQLIFKVGGIKFFPLMLIANIKRQ